MKKRRCSQKKRKRKKRSRTTKKYKGGMRFLTTRPFLERHHYERTHTYDCPTCSLSLAGLVTCEVGARLAQICPWGVSEGTILEFYAI